MESVPPASPHPCDSGKILLLSPSLAVSPVGDDTLSFVGLLGGVNNEIFTHRTGCVLTTYQVLS